MGLRLFPLAEVASA